MRRSKSRAASPRSLKVSDGFKFFGIMAHDTLYLKVGHLNRDDYARANMQPFTPYPDRSGTMKYYAVPLDVLESPLELAEWARKAIAVAARSLAR